MNKEVHYEGWLIKSPPTKRIWRARWRRRWFTLKQGEIPEQFCLEYYTDRNCRKLKGVIDLDQCEQVDCGLRLENRKQKFQYMFDIKTPRRTYYLAADTEADMRDWVNCICQVCHLHDTKQANDLQEESRTQTNVSSSLTTTISSSSNNTNNTTTTSLNSSGAVKSAVVLGQSINNSNEILRRPPVTAIEQQPQSVASVGLPKAVTAATYQNNDCAYVNTEYTNRETIMCDIRLDRQPQVNANTTAAAATVSTQSHLTPASPGAAALYLNSPVFHMHDTAARLAVNSNGVVRKIPENLVLNNTPLSDSQQNSVQPSPALSTASGPYIPISECFSGSPKFLPDSNNSTTPLNNLDPKFYDTPRCHNNIGLNLTNDQSYSPKITNCGTVQQPTPAKNRSGRSDSDSESVFTDDEEWTHPMPLRENVDRSTRPSDSSVENESFVYTYSQRFSKLPDDGTREQQSGDNSPDGADPDPLEKLAKVLKNKNNLILDIKDTEKAPRDFPQFSDTENTSPAIGPRDAKSVVEESYDIPRSHNLPYHNMGQLFEKVASPEVNPIAASTPNLMANAEKASESPNNASESPSNVRTLPRPHCYTNAAPSKIDGNVFSYDFMEQADCPPVNRKLKPKISLEDKPPEEVPAKPPVNLTQLKQSSPHNLSEGLTKKLLVSNIQSTGGNRSPGATATNVCATDHIPLHPPSVDRKLKPSAYKLGHSATIGPSMRRSTGAPLSMVLSNEHEGGYIMETRTLPRHPRPPNYTVTSSGAFNAGALNLAMNTSVCGLQIQHQRAASAAAALQMAQSNFVTMHLPLRNEHKLQYFDLDVANPPAINRQSMSVGNLNAGGSALGRFGLSADPSARAPVKSSVVYNSVDFVKTEAFKRIREERKKENEGVHMSHK